MTLLTIIQAVADEVGLPRPAIVVGSTDGAVQKMQRAANKAGSDISTRAPWQALRKEVAFTAAAGETQAGVIPSDFGNLVPETMWDRTNRRMIAGAVPPIQWQSLKATLPTGGFDRWFTLRGTSIMIYPGMAGGEACAFEYVSRNWCASSGGTPQSAWAADTDVAVLDEELITLGTVAAYLRSEGQPWEAARADYEALMVTVAATDMPSGGLASAGDIFGGVRAMPGSPAPNSGSFIPW